MASSIEKMPSFQVAQETLSPTVRGLLEDPILIEDGRIRICGKYSKNLS